VIHEEAVKEDGLLILPRFLPRQEAVIEEHPEVLFVIHPSPRPPSGNGLSRECL